MPLALGDAAAGPAEPMSACSAAKASKASSPTLTKNGEAGAAAGGEDCGTLFAADLADATWRCSKCDEEFTDGRTCVVIPLPCFLISLVCLARRLLSSSSRPCTPTPTHTINLSLCVCMCVCLCVCVCVCVAFTMHGCCRRRTCEILSDVWAALSAPSSSLCWRAHRPSIAWPAWHDLICWTSGSYIANALCLLVANHALHSHSSPAHFHVHGHESSLSVHPNMATPPFIAWLFGHAEMDARVNAYVMI
jgi:hypothetical protein